MPNLGEFAWINFGLWFWAVASGVLSVAMILRCLGSDPEQIEEPPVETNVLTLSKPGTSQRFVFMYDNSHESQTALLDTFARFARDPELLLTEYDAACLAQRAREKRGSTCTSGSMLDQPASSPARRASDTGAQP
jgi:hypothetical protein